MMTKKDNFIFQFIHVMAWVIFVRLCIEAGALLVNFIYSLFKTDIIDKLYNKLDLRQMYDMNKWSYYSIYSFAIFIAVMKAALFYVAIQLFLKFNINQPFSIYIENKIKLMSHYAFWIGLVSYIAKETANNLNKKGFEMNKLNDYWSDSHAFIMMASILYLIALIFKKGNDLQKENDLTI